MDRWFKARNYFAIHAVIKYMFPLATSDVNTPIVIGISAHAVEWRTQCLFPTLIQVRQTNLSKTWSAPQTMKWNSLQRDNLRLDEVQAAKYTPTKATCWIATLVWTISRSLHAVAPTPAGNFATLTCAWGALDVRTGTSFRLSTGQTTLLWLSVLAARSEASKAQLKA